MKIRYIILLLLLLFAIVISVAPTRPVKVEDVVGQMILVGFDGNTANSQGFKTVVEQIKQGDISGVIFFEKNIKNKTELQKMTSILSTLDEEPFIAIDQEGGSVQRLNAKNGSRFYPDARTIAQENSIRNAYEVYHEMAKELKDMNFNLNFGPCIDLIVNPNSLIAKSRRGYSADPVVVEKFGKEFISAHNEFGIVTSLKHFPGHGSPDGDTHLGLVDATKTWGRKELLPYHLLKDENHLQTVMISHIYNKTLDSEHPASLSYKITTGMLREKMGYQGVVVTDDLDMGAIKDNYLLEDVVIGAINAGSDILIFSNFKQQDPTLPRKISKIVEDAITEKKISRNRLEESYDRIAKLKKNMKNFHGKN